MLTIRVARALIRITEPMKQTIGSGPRFTKNLKSDRIRKPIAGTKMRFTKNHNLTITSVFEHD